MSGVAWSTEGRAPGVSDLRCAFARALRRARSVEWGRVPPLRFVAEAERFAVACSDARRRLAGPPPVGVARAAIRGARWRALRLALVWARRPERSRALRRTLLTHVPIPLCPACRDGIGGSFAGPDAPWRPAVAPERCAAQDHE